jgi:hypothetical protein
VLAQVYAAKYDRDWIQGICERLNGLSKNIVMVGATTAGEICEGQALSQTTVVSLSFFDSSTAVPITIDCAYGGESEATEKLIGELLKLSSPPRGVMMIATILSISIGDRIIRHPGPIFLFMFHTEIPFTG